jgi:hypothetical protein
VEPQVFLAGLKNIAGVSFSSPFLGAYCNWHTESSFCGANGNQRIKTKNYFIFDIVLTRAQLNQFDE